MEKMIMMKMMITGNNYMVLTMKAILMTLIKFSISKIAFNSSKLNSLNFMLKH